MPRCLRCETLCTTTGRRRFRLRWSPPDTRDTAPVRRYVVAALDPAYGRPLTIAVLEPDYSEELGRFVTMEEISSHILAEEELQKMPLLWTQAVATVQVAAANDAGQSSWAMLQVRLHGAATPATGRSRANGKRGAAPEELRGAADAARPEPRGFEQELRRRQGPQLRQWLQTQPQAVLAHWLRSSRWPHLGTRAELVARVLSTMGA